MKTRIISSVIIFFVLCLLLSSCLHPYLQIISSSQGTVDEDIFYVSVDGDDSNPGTIAFPFQTIQKAADVMTAGDRVFIREGVYHEMIIPMHSGTIDHPITYQAYPGETVVVDVEDGDVDAGILVKNKQYLCFNGFTVRGARVAGGLVKGPATGIDFEMMTFTQNMEGLYFFGWSDWITDCCVKACTIKENWEHGVFVYRRVSDMLITGNHVSFNGWVEDWGHNVKVVVWDEDDPATGPHDIWIVDNELDHARMQGIMTWNAHHVMIQGNHCHHNGATGIMVENGCSEIVVEDNVCELNAQVSDFETGIWVDDAYDCVIQDNIIRLNPIGFSATGCSQICVRRNMIYGNNRSFIGDTVTITGLRVDGAADSGSSPGVDNIVVHNTLYRNGHRDAQRAGVSIGDYSHRPFGISDCVFENNIVAETVGRDLWVSFSGHRLDYNDYYSVDGLDIVWKDEQYSWSQYQSVSGQDLHSLTSDPVFMNPLFEVFSLDSSSPCIDSGGWLTETVSGGLGVQVPVVDARFFVDGYGLIPGDVIMVGDSVVTVVDVDNDASVLTIDQSVSFNMGDPVSYVFEGTRPDMGAVEYVSSSSVGTLEGVTRSVETGAVLSDVMVSIGSFWDVSDESGIFRIQKVPVGVYTVTARCDGFGSQEIADVEIQEDMVTTIDVSLMQNTNPGQPSRPSGPETIMVDSMVSFWSVAGDADEDLVRLGWDWNGDFMVDEWSGFVASDTVVEMDHVFSDSGSVCVQAIAEDDDGGLSGWSDPLTVQVSREKSWVWSLLVDSFAWVQRMWWAPGWSF